VGFTSLDISLPFALAHESWSADEPLQMGYRKHSVNSAYSNTEPPAGTEGPRSIDKHTFPAGGAPFEAISASPLPLRIRQKWKPCFSCEEGNLGGEPFFPLTSLFTVFRHPNKGRTKHIASQGPVVSFTRICQHYLP